MILRALVAITRRPVNIEGVRSRLPEDTTAHTAIERNDLTTILSSHRGGEMLTAAFERAVRDPDQLLRAMGVYIQFNSAFGAGLANLSGEIAARQRLFVDPEEPVHVLADRAAEVAADFFSAAVDEFDDRATTWRDTHRTLAQATLRGMGTYFGRDAQRLNALLGDGTESLPAQEQVWDGYGIGRRLSDEELFRGMGFHVGSEILADQEFVIIDRILRRGAPDLVTSLEKTSVEASGEKHNAYYWVRIHTGVEAEHFAAALVGVNKALRFYTGPSAGVVKEWILAGFARFAEVQTAFMAGLAQA